MVSVVLPPSIFDDTPPAVVVAVLTMSIVSLFAVLIWQRGH